MPISKYNQIIHEIREIASNAGRNPDILLLAVSKGHSWSEVESVYREGCRDFGENRVQEALPKIEEAPKDVLWHFIGNLQLNKVRKIIGKFVLIHSVDTPELARRIAQCSQESGVVTAILLQVNTSGESTKSGLSVEQWRQEIDALLLLPGIRIKGLMTMAPLEALEDEVRDCFRKLRDFRDELSIKTPLPYLSMGMSHDYRIAIEEGATILRVGSALFGTLP